MKNSNNILVKTIILFTLLCVFASCKKDRAIVPEPIAEEVFDIRQYVLVTKETTSAGWVKDVQLRSFEAQSKCIVFNEGGKIPDNGFNYSYDQGTLKLFYGLQLQNELKIEDKIIKSATASVPGRSFKLIKIPTDNPLNGNTYAGGWKSEGSLLTTIASLKFTDTHYSEASINLPEPNKTYELFKNIAAFKYDAPGNVTNLWLLLDGKLEGYRKYYNSDNRVTGTFNRQ